MDVNTYSTDIRKLKGILHVCRTPVAGLLDGLAGREDPTAVWIPLVGNGIVARLEPELAPNATEEEDVQAVS